MDKIEKDVVTTINYKLSVDGTEVESNELTYLHGHKNIIEGLEKELEGLTPGDKKSVHVPSGEAYGDYQPELVQTVNRKDFPENQAIEVGMQFQTQTPQGTAVFAVKAIENDMITMDGNHPMAGKDLSFDIEVKELREASKEELEHGHVHGPGGHHH